MRHSHLPAPCSPAAPATSVHCTGPRAAARARSVHFAAPGPSASAHIPTPRRGGPDDTPAAPAAPWPDRPHRAFAPARPPAAPRPAPGVSRRRDPATSAAASLATLPTPRHSPPAGPTLPPPHAPQRYAVWPAAAIAVPLAALQGR